MAIFYLDTSALVTGINALIASGKKIEEIKEDYPELDEEDVKQSLEYAAWTVSEKVLPLTL